LSPPVISFTLFFLFIVGSRSCATLVPDSRWPLVTTLAAMQQEAARAALVYSFPQSHQLPRNGARNRRGRHKVEYLQAARSYRRGEWGWSPPTAGSTMKPHRSPPRLQVQEEEEKGVERRKKAQAAPLSAAASFATASKDADQHRRRFAASREGSTIAGAPSTPRATRCH
jgi:hypothetical protein